MASTDGCKASGLEVHGLHATYVVIVWARYTGMQSQLTQLLSESVLLPKVTCLVHRS